MLFKIDVLKNFANFAITSGGLIDYLFDKYD